MDCLIDICYFYSDKRKREYYYCCSNFVGVKSKIFECKINDKDYSAPYSSNLATAYISGCLALVLEESPLITADDIFNEFFKKEFWNFDISNKFHIPQNSVIVLHSVLDNNLLHYKGIIDSNVLGYIDSVKSKIINFDGEEVLGNIENIIEINSTEKKRFHF